MRALVYDGTAVRFRHVYPDPVLPMPAAGTAAEIGAPASGGDALLRVRLAGLCQTDLEIARGYMGFTGVLGHEFVATVEKVSKGADTQWVGKRVVGEINCVCGKCDMCSRGLSTHCRRRTVLGIHGRDGAFADALVLPIRNLHAVPDNVSDEQAVFIEPLAAAFQIPRQVQIEKRTRVVVLGDGRLGLLVAQVLHGAGCVLTLVGRHESKLAVAEKLGIQTALDPEYVPHGQADVVVDCTGRAKGVERALELVRLRGTVVLKTTVAAANPLNLAPIVIDEITVLGSRCGPFPDAIHALATGKIYVLPLITRRTPIANAESLFPSPSGLKTLITF